MPPHAQAGGHLAALTSTRFTSRASRPDSTTLFYPVISMAMQNYSHANSRREYLGSAPSATVEVAFSADQHVSAASPPAFLIHARDDHVVNSRSSRIYFEAARRHGVSATFVELEAGGHPFVNKARPWQTASSAAVAWLCDSFGARGQGGRGHSHFRSVDACSRRSEQQQQQGALRSLLLGLPGVAAVWQT